MNVAIVTSVSPVVADIAVITVPNKLRYCIRHGYSLVVDNQPYEEAVRNTHFICSYLDRFDLVWLMDADTLITDMRQRIETLPCIGPHWTVCEEGIVEWNRINCGSIVIRNTHESRVLLKHIHDSEPKWKSMPCLWQTYLGVAAMNPPDLLTVAPLRSFNSCVWNRPANTKDEIGGHWQPGDFVYHTCGVYPLSERASWLTRACESVIE